LHVAFKKLYLQRLLLPKHWQQSIMLNHARRCVFFFFFFFNIILEGDALQVVNAVNMEIKLQLEQNGSSYRWNQRRFGQVKIMKG
jgi:hypothetical protein